MLAKWLFRIFEIVDSSLVVVSLFGHFRFLIVEPFCFFLFNRSFMPCQVFFHIRYVVVKEIKEKILFT